MKILLVQTGFLGDVILSSAVIGNLSELYPGAEISVLTTPQAEELVKFHPAVKNVLVFDKRRTQRGILGLWKMARILRAKHFDAAFSLHKSYRTAILLWLAQIPRRYGFNEASLRWLYTARGSRSDLSHEVLRNLGIFRAVGREPESLNSKLHIEIPETARRDAEGLLKGHSAPFVGIAPGSVWATKRWTVAGFATAAKELSALGYTVVLIGGTEDAGVCSAIAEKAGGAAVNLAGLTRLILSAAVIDRLELLITNDSAPLHLASARSIPVVAVFCATVPEFGYGPWQVRGECVGVSGLSCRPCGRHGGQTCPTGTHACQLDLSPQVVVAAARRILDSKSSIVPEKGESYAR